MVSERRRATTVVIIEDHLILTDALMTLINGTHDLVMVGSADTCAAGLKVVEQTQPKVVVLDVALPDGDGIRLVPEVRRRQPAVSILIMTSLDDKDTLQRAITAGVNGFVPKRRPAVELLTAIRQAAAGEMVISPSLLLSLIKTTPAASRADRLPLRADLTAREREVLSQLVHGKSGPEIAAALNIAAPTVRTHVGNLMTKLSAHSRLEAVAVALREGLVENPF